eukprot:gene43026-57221_t
MTVAAAIGTVLIVAVAFLSPVLAPHTLILWTAAPTVLVIGGIVLFVVARRRRRATVGEAALTPEEQKALDELG